MSSYDLSMKYVLDSRENIDICIDENDMHIIAFASLGQEIGRIELDEGESCYHIRWMYLDKLGDKYLRQGIGEACLKFFKETYDCCITAAYDTGITNDYGDYLTGDAPSFISKMRDKGIVQP